MLPHSPTGLCPASSSKLSQRLIACMASTLLGDAVNGLDNQARQGMEMLQAIIDHFVPCATVNLPSIFREWNDLHQKKDEQVVVFSNRVVKLAGRSKRAAQAFTKSSQILTLLKGLHDGFSDFTKDYFSGRLLVAETSLRDTTALAKTLELTMDRTSTPRLRDNRRGCTRRINGATPNNAAVNLNTKPLSRAQVDGLFSNFKCPLHRVNNHDCCDCFAFGDNGYVIFRRQLVPVVVLVALPLQLLLPRHPQLQLQLLLLLLLLLPLRLLQL